MNKAIFLDRDGVLNKDTGYPHKIEDFILSDGVVSGLKKLKDFKFFIISPFYMNAWLYNSKKINWVGFIENNYKINHF